MKEIFINKTKCSKKEYNMFIKSHQQQYGLKEDLYTLIYVIFFISFIIYSLKNSIYFAVIMLIIVLILFLAYRIIYPNIVVKKELKSKKIIQEQVNTYNFYKYYFKVENNQGKSNIMYFKIFKVLENKTHIYLYLTNTRAFVVSGFEKGTSEDFSKFLRKRVWFRYKIQKSNS